MPRRNDALYKRVFYHAVRRAILENENYMKVFMEKAASGYNDEMLELLDKILVEICDNDLFNLIMKHTTPEDTANILTLRGNGVIRILRDLIGN